MTGTTYSILVVDDSPIDRRITARLLMGDSRFELMEAEDGEQAIQLLRQTSPDLVLTDLQMPEVNGLELLTWICRNSPQIPVILMTARGSEELAVQALTAGAASYVPKARLPQELVPTVARVLTAQRSRELAERVQQCLLSTECRYRLALDPQLLIAAAGMIEEMLVKSWSCPARDALRIRMALEEALLNALYHGNLELDPRLREVNLELYHELASKRVTELPWRDRVIQLRVVMAADRLVLEVTDEGSGFNPAPFLEQIESSVMERPFGRGILLMRTATDEVNFRDQGRTVSLTRFRHTLSTTDDGNRGKHDLPAVDDVIESGFVLDSEDAELTP